MIPLPVWTRGTDPDGAEYYACPDPTDPAWRVTVTSLAIYGRTYWTLDYVRADGWWWEREGRWSLAHAASAEEGMHSATLFLYGSRGAAHFGEWVWSQIATAAKHSTGEDR
jgi:hypothetical protein